MTCGEGTCGAGGCAKVRSATRAAAVRTRRNYMSESRAAPKARVRVALDPLKHLQRRALGAFGVAGHGHVRSESRFSLGAPPGVGRSILRTAGCGAGSANRVGPKPPAATAEPHVFP